VAVALPIISYLKVQCCVVPTSIFSNHTGFSSYFFDDYTNRMESYIQEWKKLNLKFEAITSGFLGSKEQIAIVKQFIQEFKTKRTQIVIDPVMGDNGKLYSIYNDEMCQEMKSLIEYADIITPNLTECCILTETPYHEEKWKIKDLLAMAMQISNQGPSKVVVTGIHQGDFIANLVYEKGKEFKILRTHRVGTERSGTGDVFSAIITADAVNGVAFDKSVKKASNFIKKCILRSIELDIPKTDGVCFEEVLHTLSLD
jgi:pyridoxine kinase